MRWTKRSEIYVRPHRCFDSVVGDGGAGAGAGAGGGDHSKSGLNDHSAMERGGRVSGAGKRRHEW